MKSVDVAAVVPNYNMGESLEELLPTLLEQEYQGVFVLDDASTDHSVEVVRSFGGDVTLVSGETNVGAAANRNRIIPAGLTGTIHFIDADMILETDRVPERAAEVMDKPEAGIVGGLVKDLDGMQFGYNYGPKLTAISAIASPLQAYLAGLSKTDPARAQKLRDRTSFLTKDWVDVLATPISKEVFWVSEANMFVDAAMFARVNGFNPKLRHHDIQDVAMKFERLGIKRYFDPTVEATHKAIKVRKMRQIDFAKAYLQLVRTYGLEQLF